MEIIFSSYGKFNNHKRIGPAEWPNFDLLFIHDGEVNLVIGGEAPLRICKGQAVLLFPHTPFHGKSITARTKASVHHFLISASSSGTLQWPLRQIYGKQRGYEFLDSMGNIQIAQDLDRSLRLRESSTEAASHAMQCNLLCLSLTQLHCGPGSVPSSVSRQSLVALNEVLDWLSENLDKSIALSEMANRSKLSESHFRRLFRQQHGISPGRYHQEQRKREACRVLRESALPVKAISKQLGFEDLAHFYRAFKKHTGIPPAEYRKKNSPIG